MKSFQDIIQTQGYEFLNNLMNDYVLVYEKLSASTLSFKRVGDELHFYKGSNKEEITSINAALYTYFQKGIDYIKNVSLVFYREFPENWLFSFKYFVDNKTNVIEYDYMPKNNLVLSFIDNGTNLIEDPDILRKWADRLQTDYAQPLFQGFFTEFQKEKIGEYVNGKTENDVPFSQYIISLLNPSMSHSNYKNGFTGGVDSFICKFYSPNSKKCVCAKIMDPYMASILKAGGNSFEKNKYGNETEIILANFIAFLQTVNIDKIEVVGSNDEERYLDLICKLFNIYIEKEKGLYLGNTKKVDENYSVNYNNIKNEETIRLLKDNPNLVTTFQIIVGNFAQYKNPETASPLSLLNNELIGVFNSEVSKIKSASMEKKEKTKTFAELMAGDNTDKKEHEDKVLSYEEFAKKEGLPNDVQPSKDIKPKQEDEPPVKKEQEHKEEESDKGETKHKEQPIDTKKEEKETNDKKDNEEPKKEEKDETSTHNEENENKDDEENDDKNNKKEGENEGEQENNDVKDEDNKDNKGNEGNEDNNNKQEEHEQNNINGGEQKKEKKEKEEEENKKEPVKKEQPKKEEAAAL